MEDEVVSELEEYVESVSLEGTIRPMIEALLRKKPQNHLEFMMDFLCDLESRQRRSSTGSRVLLYVSHKDASAAQCLRDHGLMETIRELVQVVVNDTKDRKQDEELDMLTIMEESLSRMRHLRDHTQDG